MVAFFSRSPAFSTSTPLLIRPLFHNCPFVHRRPRATMSSSTPTPPNKPHPSAMTDVNKDGRFTRKPSTFRNFITPSPTSPFPPSPNRYHLYVSLACPWASRVLIVRSLKGLQKILPLTVTHHKMQPDTGWRFISPDDPPNDIPPECHPEPHAFTSIRQLYFLADPNYNGRFTVPVLWDTQQQTIVNNESSEIIVMLNSVFDQYAENPSVDLYPEPLRPEIDKIADSFYNAVNNGVYRCGFARSQQAYDEAVEELFNSLDTLDAHLANRRYLVGNQLTLADIRLFVTLVRFDAVYVGHFKTNKKRIFDYPNLSKYTADVYQHPGIAPTVNMEHIKKHYHMSHPSINPYGIVPAGPDISYLHQSHGRDAL